MSGGATRDGDGPASAAAHVPTVRLAPLVYGDDSVPLDDPAEAFHEASKIYPSFAARQTRGRLLEMNEELRFSSARSVKRRHHVPTVALPDPCLPDVSFARVVEDRVSRRDFGSDPIPLAELAALLHAAYGVTHTMFPDRPPDSGPAFRAVPSGGGLYPLEVDVFAWNVSELAVGRYHFDPLGRVLEVIDREDMRGAVRSASVYPDIAGDCAAYFVVSAMFWRTRFKYGLRGYRFALIEAGHLAQNLLLAASAFGRAAVPLGGLFDRRMDELLGLDGVNESVVYAVAVGAEKRSGDAG